MKTILKTFFVALLLVTPSTSFAEGLTGKTLSKTIKSAPASSEGSISMEPTLMPQHFLSSESTPCYAIDQVSEYDLDRLIEVGLFFGNNLGDSNPILDVQALGSTNIAVSLLVQGFDNDTIFAFLKAQLRFIYNCP